MALPRRFARWVQLALGLTIAVVLGFWFWLEFDARRNRLPSSTVRVLDNAEEFVLYSLDPPMYRDPKAEPPQELFHDYAVLGKAEISQTTVRKELLKALYAGIAEADGRAPRCFNPRHGIRASFRGESVDVVICFECSRIESYATRTKFVYTSQSPQPKFDEVLKKAGVPLAEKRH